MLPLIPIENENNPPHNGNHTPQPRDSEGRYHFKVNKKKEGPWIPNGDNRPPDAEVTLRFCGQQVGSTGNLTVLSAWAGAGKSAICEAICASHLNKTLMQGNFVADCFELETFLKLNQKILYVDGERSKGDNWASWRRIMYRAQIPYTEYGRRIVFSEEMQAVIANLIMQAHCPLNTIEDRLSAIENTVEKEPIGMVIIDGLGDLIMDANHAEHATRLWLWINALLQKEVSIFATVHTNPNSEKARGHLGTEAIRRSEGSILLEKMPDKIRRFTTDFDFGKVRNGSIDNTTYFEWGDDEQMFVTSVTNAPPSSNKEIEKKAKLDKLLAHFEAGKSYTYSELKSIIESKERCSDKTAERKITKMVESQHLFRLASGLYSTEAF